MQSQRRRDRAARSRASKAALTLLSGPGRRPGRRPVLRRRRTGQNSASPPTWAAPASRPRWRSTRRCSSNDGEIARHKIALPMLDIHTIGAGGGSIGWLDEGGLLRMGPQSAGADPGPACYGKGGTLPTTTDANLVLGYLDPDYFAGGQHAARRRRGPRARSSSTSPSRWACRSRRRRPACTASPATTWRRACAR